MLYHSMEMQSSISFPVQLLRPTLSIIQQGLSEEGKQLATPGLAVTNPTPTTARPSTPPAYMIAMPKETAPLTWRRKPQAKTLPEIMNLVKQYGYNDCPDLFRGVTEVEHYILLLDMSCDGVALFNQSSTGNSNEVFSFYINNMVKRRMLGNYDAFIAFLIPSEQSEEKTKSNNTCVLVENNQMWGGRDDPIRSYHPFDTHVECEYKKTGIPNGANFRELTGSFLKQSTKKGKEGFAIREGSKLKCIQFAFKSARADIPASNTLLDSNGKMHSNYYCPYCTAVRMYYEPLLNDFVENVRLCITANRKTLYSNRSAMASLPKSDNTRLLPLAQYLYHFPNQEEIVIGALKQKLAGINATNNSESIVNHYIDQHVSPAIKTLQTVVSMLPTGMTPTLGPNPSFFAEYPAKEELKATNADKGCGKIDIPNNTFLSLDNAIAFDTMHAMHKFVDDVLNLLFYSSVKPVKVGSSPYKVQSSGKTPGMNTLLNEGRKLFGYSKINYNYTRVSSDIRERIKKRWKSIDPKVMKLPFVKSVVNGEKPNRIVAADKMRFAFCFLPLLTIDCMHDEKVWCIVNLLGLLGRYYCFSGPISTSKELQYLVDIVLCLMEQYFEPKFTSIYYHYLTHLHLCYRTHGLLKDCDCLHCEAQYKGLGKLFFGGTNPQVSIMEKLIAKKSAEIFACNNNTAMLVSAIQPLLTEEKQFLLSNKGKVVCSQTIKQKINYFARVVQDCETVVQALHLTNLYEMSARAEVLWLADQVRFHNDLVPVPSFTDIEFCGGYQASLQENTSLVDTGLKTVDEISWASSLEDIYHFIHSHPCDLSLPTRFQKVQLVSSFRFNKVKYESLYETWDHLTTSSFSKKAFALFKSVLGTTRLMGIYAYLFFYTRKSVYITAIVYEIPTHPCLPFSNSPHSFLVDLSAERQRTQFTLISIHRLQMESMCFFRVAENEMYGTPGVSNIYQWKVFKNVEFTIDEFDVYFNKHSYISLCLEI